MTLDQYKKRAEQLDTLYDLAMSLSKLYMDNQQALAEKYVYIAGYLLKRKQILLGKTIKYNTELWRNSK